MRRSWFFLLFPFSWNKVFRAKQSGLLEVCILPALPSCASFLRFLPALPSCASFLRFFVVVRKRICGSRIVLCEKIKRRKNKKIREKDVRIPFLYNDIRGDKKTFSGKDKTFFGSKRRVSGKRLPPPIPLRGIGEYPFEVRGVSSTRKEVYFLFGRRRKSPKGYESFLPPEKIKDTG